MVMVGSLDSLNGVSGIAVVGDIAYVADFDAGLVIVDISDRAHPVELSRVSVNGHAADVAYSNGYAFVTDEFDSGLSSLLVFDVSNPTAPRFRQQLGPRGARDVIVDGTTLYLAAERDGLKIYDLTPLTRLALIASVPMTAAFGLDLVGDRLYVSGAPFLSILDVSDPAAPVTLGSVTGPLAGNAVDAEAGFAYVVSDAFSFAPAILSIFDLSDPAAPALVATVEGAGPTEDIQVVGSIAYVTSAQKGLIPIDVSDPLAPMMLGRFSPEFGVSAVTIESNLAYLGPLFAIADVSTPETPVVTKSFDAAVGWDLAFGGDHIVYYASADGFFILDVSDPLAPVELASLGRDSRGVEVDGDTVYLLESSSLHVIDASDPSTPSILGTIGLWQSFAYADGYAYLVTSPFVNGRLDVVDVSDPTAMSVVGSFVFPDGVRDVDIEGSHAYVAGEDGLWVVDVSDPTAPSPVGMLSLPFLRSVTVADGVAYVLDGGLEIIDVSDPTAPASLATVDRRGHEVAITGHLAFVSTGDRVWAANVEDPSSPRILGGISGLPRAGDQAGIAFGDDVVWAAGGDGLYRIDFGPEYPIARTISAAIDIKPGSEPNNVSPMSQGQILVAVLGSETLDVDNIDPSTLAFGPNGAPALKPARGTRLDVNRDGTLDIVFRYGVPSTGIALGDTQACLRGALQDGTMFEGCDTIQTVPPCGSGYAAAMIVPPIVLVHRRRRSRTRKSA